MNVGKYIYSKLAADAGVTALVSTRIYPIFIPKSAALPAIVFVVNEEPNTTNKTNPATHDRATVTFRYWADAADGVDAYEKINSIHAAVRTVLDYVDGTAGGVTVDVAHFDSVTDGRDEEMTLFMKEATYTFLSRNA